MLHPDCPKKLATTRRVEIGRSCVEIGRSSGFDEEMDWLLEILQWPIEWTSLHGIAEIKTPVLKVSASTDATATRYVVQRQGSRYPEEGATGLGFPFRVPHSQKEFVSIGDGEGSIAASDGKISTLQTDKRRKKNGTSQSIQLTGLPTHVVGVKERDMEGELLVYRDKNGVGATLNRSARSIWKLCDGQRSISAISEELEHDLKVPSGALLFDVKEAVEKLIEAELLTFTDQILQNKDQQRQVDWRRIAEPQPDQYDALTALKLFASRSASPSQGFSNSDGTTLCDGAVRLGYCYQDGVEGLVDAPLDHPNLAMAEAYLRRWPVAFEQFRLLMNSLHPRLLPNMSDDASAFLSGF